MSAISVVVPALNEAPRIASSLARLRAELGDDAEIVVVDDGSSDETARVAGEAGADVVVRLPMNVGKGGAVRAGVGRATGDVIVFTDADLSYAPEQVAQIAAQVACGHPMVVGTRRHLDTTTLVRARPVRQVGGRAFNWLCRAALRERHDDTQCGLKGFAAPTAKLLFACGQVDGFAFDVELFRLAELFAIPITEAAVVVSNTTSSSVRLSRDAATMLRDLWRIRRWSQDGTYDRRRRDFESPPTTSN